MPAEKVASAVVSAIVPAVASAPTTRRRDRGERDILSLSRAARSNRSAGVPASGRRRAKWGPTRDVRRSGDSRSCCLTVVGLLWECSGTDLHPAVLPRYWPELRGSELPRHSHVRWHGGGGSPECLMQLSCKKGVPAAGFEPALAAF